MNKILSIGIVSVLFLVGFSYSLEIFAQEHTSTESVDHSAEYYLFQTGQS